MAPSPSTAASKVESLPIDDDPDDDSLSTPSGLFAACRRRVESFLAQQVEALFSRAHERLFADARDAPTDDMQRESFDAMQELHRVKDAVSSDFVQGVLEHLDALWSAEVIHDLDEPEELDVDDMSLLDTQSLDDEVQVMGIVTQALPALRAGEHALSKRLSELLPAPVGPDANPIGIRQTCMTFHGAVQNLGAELASRRALFWGLHATVVQDLGALHQELNELLLAQGVLPKIPLRVPAGVPRQAGPKPDPAHDVPNPPNAPAQSLTGVPSQAGRVDPSLSIPFSAASDSARRLMALTRGAAPTAADGGPQIPDQAPNQAPGQTLDRALAKIQRSGVVEKWGERGPLAFAVRLRKALEKLGMELRDPAAVDTVGVISTLVDSILADPLVQSGTKPWIRRLALPLTRIALRDGGFFASESHPARKMVNRLGLLVMAAQDEDPEEIGAAAESVAVLEALIDAQAAERDGFQRAASALARTLKGQNRRFEQRVGELSAAHAQQQAVLEARREPPLDPPADPESSTDAERSDPAWLNALEAVSRLDPGDVVVLGADTNRPRPVSLVWRSPEREILVFANALGRSAASFARRELAMALRRGQVRLAEEARMPIVDRAMCSVLRGLHEKLEKKATQDRLTKLANRKQFELELGRAMGRAPENGRGHHLCLVGLEGLDDITAQHGPRAANTLLRQFAPLLARQVGTKGVAAHVERGRFAVLMSDSPRSDVLQLMARHRRSVELSQCVYHGDELKIVVSICVVEVAPEATQPASVLDKVLSAYDTTRAGAGPGLHVHAEPISGDGAVASAGRDAQGAPGVAELITEGRLALRCQRVQPIDAAGDLQAYYEVLLGVRDDGGNLAPPGEVIRTAELAGDITALDRWVVNEALEWMARNDRRISSLAGIAINLSGATLSDPTLTGFVTERLAQHGIDPQRIIFEVTESAAIDRLSVAQEFMEALRSRGCRFALDDFGAGHASFSYLKLLPVDTVKIDGMFVKDILANPADEAMVRSIHEVSRLLDKRTVAEYVKDEQVLQRLEEIGIDYAQGFGIERPIAIDEIVASAAWLPAQVVG